MKPIISGRWLNRQPEPPDQERPRKNDGLAHVPRVLGLGFARTAGGWLPENCVTLLIVWAAPRPDRKCLLLDVSGIFLVFSSVEFLYFISLDLVDIPENSLLDYLN
jgi:hypothetical protein